MLDQATVTELEQTAQKLRVDILTHVYHFERDFH
jgi:hypothetical protein